MWSIVRLGAFVPAEQKPDQWSREEEPGARWRREYNRTLEAGRKREAWGHAKARGGGEAEDKCFTWEPRPPCLSLSGRYVETARFLRVRPRARPRICICETPSSRRVTQSRTLPTLTRNRIEALLPPSQARPPSSLHGSLLAPAQDGPPRLPESPPSRAASQHAPGAHTRAGCGPCETAARRTTT